jgi:Brp/Blh family beta-carotene 15,15'-monooxygenase
LAVAVQIVSPEPWLVPIMLCLIAVGGMPHGGLDLLVASTRFPLSKASQRLMFVVTYLALAAIVAAFWSVYPTAALAAFLLYSALHFGSDWTRKSPLASLLAGLALLAQPALAATSETATLFTALGAQGDLIAASLAWSGAAATPFVVWTLRHDVSGLLILLGLGCLSFALNPLAWFFIYFCGIHGPRHMRRVALAHDISIRSLSRHWIRPALIAGALVVSAGLLLIPVAGFEAAAMQAVFVGFAALTVPHMVLVDFAAGYLTRLKSPHH